MQGFQRIRRSPGIATKCLAGKTRLVRAPRGAVTLTGESVSSNAVAGSSTRGTINAKQTNDISKTEIAQRKSFTGFAPKSPTKYAPRGCLSISRISSPHAGSYSWSERAMSRIVRNPFTKAGRQRRTDRCVGPNPFPAASGASRDLPLQRKRHFAGLPRI